MFCNACKKEIDITSKFCEFCGYEVKKVSISDLVDKASEEILHPERKKKRLEIKRKKISIALLASSVVFLLIGALGDLDYDFYTLLRFYIFSVSLFLCFFEYKNNEELGVDEKVLIWLAISILFNPLFPITLEDRDIWIFIDFALAGFFSYKAREIYLNMRKIKI